jgi:hypothetical protein
MNCLKCKHTDNEHSSSLAYPARIVCWVCFGGSTPWGESEPYHEFQMDNLDLIEQLAKKRNLI